MPKSMTEIKLGFMTQAQVLKVLMDEHGYNQMAAIDAVDNELHEIWSKLTPGHTTTFSRIASAVVALRTTRSEQVRRRQQR